MQRRHEAPPLHGSRQASLALRGAHGMSEVIFDSVSAIARRIRDRDTSAVEVMQIHLARIDAVNPLLNAVVTRCDEMALARAREADAALVKGQVAPLKATMRSHSPAFIIGESTH
jgi:amidase